MKKEFELRRLLMLRLEQLQTDLEVYLSFGYPSLACSCRDKALELLEFASECDFMPRSEIKAYTDSFNSYFN